MRLPLAVAAVAAILVSSTAQAATPGIHVSGNQLVGRAGQPVQLVGVNRSSFESTCVSPIYSDAYRNGVHDGPVGARAVSAFRTWHVNAVRIPLNEDCWLGVNPVKRTPEGVVRLHGQRARVAGAKERQRYRKGVADFVEELGRHEIVVILDLHWTGPGRDLADGQLHGPDTSHSIDFWRSVAKRFRSDEGVIFDLFNEPKDLSWKCLRDGGCPLPPTCPDCKRAKSGTVVGMQKLVNVVRKAGATQPLMIPGREYSSDLRKWLQYEPHDPLASTPIGPQLVASFHNYGYDQNQGYICHQRCWDEVIAPLAARVPVVTGEFGQGIGLNIPNCGRAYNDAYLDWADAHGVSYIAWAWYVPEQGDSQTCLDLISDYQTGAPTQYGAPIRDHFVAHAP